MRPVRAVLTVMGEELKNRPAVDMNASTANLTQRAHAAIQYDQAFASEAGRLKMPTPDLPCLNL